jgi:hypothetical protein
MRLSTLFIVIIFHLSVAFSYSSYPNQAFKLQNHPLSCICTVHVTVVSFQSHTSSDVTERFLTSNHDMIIPTLSTMHNRSLRIVPVISFFEPCTISVLVDAIIDGSSYVNSHLGIARYISANTYVFSGWKHSAIIVFHFSCEVSSFEWSNFLPHRLFYHLLNCGPHNQFPNYAFVPTPFQKLRRINDISHNIHHQQLPLDIRRSLSKPKYDWNQHNVIGNLKICSSSQWNQLSLTNFCKVNQLAVYHYQYFLNFTTQSFSSGEGKNYGQIITSRNLHGRRNSIQSHIVESKNTRIIYCDHKLDSPQLRPLTLLGPFSWEAWIFLGSMILFLAIMISFVSLESNSRSNNWISLSQKSFSKIF